MKKKDLIDKLSKQINKSKQETSSILDEFSDLITSTLKGGDEIVWGLGKFQLKQRPARSGINPSTGERIHLAAKVVPAFKPNKQFKQSVLE